MSRLAKLPYEQMSKPQKAVYDAIVAGPRGRIGGPMEAWLRVPKLADLSQKLGSFCRYETGLEPQHFEMVVLTIARKWTAQAEWQIHRPIALKAGLDASIIAAIEARQVPEFADDEIGRVCYQTATQLQDTFEITNSLFDHAVIVLGEARLVELIAVIGYYTSVAMVLNAFQVQVSNEDAATPPLKR